jgi:hypothetical protein
MARKEKIYEPGAHDFQGGNPDLPKKERTGKPKPEFSRFSR